MEYSIKAVSSLAGVSARTLRYYDEIGLLSPSRTTEAGYRFYGEGELTLLQQILFYRERGFPLEQIRKLVYSHDFDVLAALHDHLQDLESQRTRLESLIGAVKKTIQAEKGETTMSNEEKFQTFKEAVVEENEKNYGKEARGKYGNKEVNGSNKKILQMTEEEYTRFQKLGEGILERLVQAVHTKAIPQGEDGQKIALLHKDWLCMTWKEYSPQAHRGLAELYVADERFTAYYEKAGAGSTQFLRDAVAYWIGKKGMAEN